MGSKECLVFASDRIGYYAPDDPEPGSEAGRWMAEKLGQSWLAGPSWEIWWCACFGSMSVYQGGNGTLPGGPQYNTDAAVTAARAANKLVSKADARPGDQLVFDWNFGTLATDHWGIMELNRGANVQTIEGNTSSGAAGSQSAGNGVWRRVRSWDDVRYVIRPDWPTAPPVAPGRVLWVPEDGYWGVTTTLGLQIINGTPRDQIISAQDAYWKREYGEYFTSGWEWITSTDPEGSQLIAHVQTYMQGLGTYLGKIDGLVGPKFVAALIATYRGGSLHGAILNLQKAINKQLGA